MSLDDLGHAEAERAARLLALLEPGAIASSDLRRAADTALVLARMTGVRVAYDKDLRERHMGRWEGLTAADVRLRWPDEWSARQPAGGETLAEVARRVEDAIIRVLDASDRADTVVVVGHGSALRLGMARLLGLPEKLWSRIGALANCTWSVLGEDSSGWRLIEHNAGTLPEPVRGDDR